MQHYWHISANICQRDVAACVIIALVVGKSVHEQAQADALESVKHWCALASPPCSGHPNEGLINLSPCSTYHCMGIDANSQLFGIIDF